MTEEFKLLIGVLVIVIGALYGLVLRTMGKQHVLEMSISNLTGKFDSIESRTELAVRRVIERHEEREFEKYDQVVAQITDLREVLAEKKC